MKSFAEFLEELMMGLNQSPQKVKGNVPFEALNFKMMCTINQRIIKSNLNSD